MMKSKLIEYKQLGNLMNSIYKITSPSGKIYIGQFLTIDRLKSYITKNCKYQPALYNSLVKYGPLNHTVLILTHSQKSKHLDLYLKAFIRYYDSFTNGLNCTLGGDGKTKYADLFCQELWLLNKNGMNLTLISRKVNIKPSVIGRLIKRTGNIPIIYRKKRTILHCIKISLSNKGKKSSFKGKKLSNLSKMKISKANKGRKKIIPTVAQDENGIFQLVYPFAYGGRKRNLSEWHYCCDRLFNQINYKRRI